MILLLISNSLHLSVRPSRLSTVMSVIPNILHTIFEHSHSFNKCIMVFDNFYSFLLFSFFSTSGYRCFEFSLMHSHIIQMKMGKINDPFQKSSGAVFTTFHFLRNLRMGQISESVCNWQNIMALCNLMLQLIRPILK
jgi:hypothetical protein